MNYFGHAAVAGLRTGEPRFVLGAMLPDLVPMAGVTVPRSLVDAELTRGVAFHLETDALFHATDTFVAWNRRTLAALRGLGISRGPARACAHIGVEMLIDAELTQRSDAFILYEDALRYVIETPEVLAPMSRDEQMQSSALCRHLLQRGRSVFEPSAERFSLRLGRTLAFRPRLRPSTSELMVIADYLSHLETPRTDVHALMVELEPLWQKSQPTGTHSSRPAS